MPKFTDFFKARLLDFPRVYWSLTVQWLKLLGLLSIIGFVLFGIYAMAAGLFKELINTYEGASNLYKEIRFFIDSPVKFIVKQNPVQGTFYLIWIGVLFYLLKKFQQFWYGTIEFLFAALYSFNQFNLIQKQASSGALEYTAGITALATIYLIVRGINNIDDGYKKNYLGKRLVRLLVEE